MAWDMYAILILLYTIVVAPLKIGFDVEDYCPNPVWVWEAVVDGSFIFDLLLSFVTGVYTSDDTGKEQLVTAPTDIARIYFRSWFIIDFVSCLPIDMVFNLNLHGCASAAFGGIERDGGINGDIEGLAILKMVRILRLVKLLKILRVLRLQQRFNNVADRFPFLYNLTIFRLLSPLFVTLYVAHLIACGWYFIGAASYYDPMYNEDSSGEVDNYEVRSSWLTTASFMVKPTPGLEWHEIGVPYAASLYWTFTTITTVGYGDLIPSSTGEQFYAIVAMIVGTGIFGNIISSSTCPPYPLSAFQAFCRW